MPFYLRKSLNAGIFRFNLSKSGLGVSTGIRGFRIGTGPGGNYIHMGANGLYYRSTWSGKGKSYSPPHAPSYEPTPISENLQGGFTEIESADILKFQDISSTNLLSELNKKYKVPVYWFIVSMLCTVSALTLPIPIISLISGVDSEAARYLAPAFYCLGISFAVITSIFLYNLNEIQKNIIIFYTMESELEKAYEAVHGAYRALQSCSRVWHIQAQGKIHGPHQQKLSSGANTLAKRALISLSIASPEWVKTNIAIPRIPVGRQMLYLFPDRILIRDGKRFGAIPYPDIDINIKNSQFIESDIFPSDAKMVGKTWKYPNKDGGPDRRFRDNYEVPIALYSEMHFTSSKGLNELIQLSKVDMGSEFADAIRHLAHVIQISSSQKKMASNKSLAS